jgi:hypothetical protein
LPAPITDTLSLLALLATLLGSGTAYLALAAGHRGDISVLSRVPVPDLTITIAGVPATAAMAGWVLSGRSDPRCPAAARLTR